MTERTGRRASLPALASLVAAQLLCALGFGGAIWLLWQVHPGELPKWELILILVAMWAAVGFALLRFYMLWRYAEAARRLVQNHIVQLRGDFGRLARAAEDMAASAASTSSRVGGAASQVGELAAEMGKLVRLLVLPVDMAASAPGAVRRVLSKALSDVQCERIKTADGHHLGLIRLAREKSLNALSLGMVRRISRQLRKWSGDERLVAVVMEGAGERAFCAGGDINLLYKEAAEQRGARCPRAETFFAEEYRLDYLIHHYPKPIICLGDGIVMGGGLGLMAGASHRVVTERSRLAMPEISIGFYPDVGGSWFLSRMNNGTGLFWALTGTPLNAADALHFGLADHLLHSSARSWLLSHLQCANWDGDGRAHAKQVGQILGQLAMPDAEAPQARAAPLEKRIAAACKMPSVAEFAEALEREGARDGGDWLQRPLKTLRAGSALSARLIFMQLRRSQGLELAEVFRQELVLSSNMVREADFVEGVRALIIDKDNKPKWQWDSPDAVPDELLQAIYHPPWAQNPLADLGEQP